MPLPPKPYTGHGPRRLKERRIYWDASLSMALWPGVNDYETAIQVTFLDDNDRPHRVLLTQAEAEYLGNRLKSLAEIAHQRDVLNRSEA